MITTAYMNDLTAPRLALWLRLREFTLAPAAVIDAIYKAEEPAGFAGDFYQMFAYCTALGPAEGHLAHTKDNEPNATFDVSVSITAYWLDMSQPPLDVLLQTRSLATRIASVYGKAFV